MFQSDIENLKYFVMPIFIEQDMVFHSREDPLTREQQTMYGCLSLEPYHFL